MAMDPSSLDFDPEDILYDYSPFLVITKDGCVHRLLGTCTVPPSLDPLTGVDSKDVLINPNISARLYKPKLDHTQKLPLVIYFHGGGFVVEAAFSPTYHDYLNPLASQVNAIVVSVDYRRAPEHPVPIAHDDSWDALHWVASHSSDEGSFTEPWLKDHADFSRVFFMGDSAGANIAHQVTMRVSTRGLPGVNLKGIILVHPYFWGKHPVGKETKEEHEKNFAGRLWPLAYPTSSGLDDPLINPATDPDLGELGCKRVLIMVAELDGFRERGYYYNEALEKSGWPGVVRVEETLGEDHVFHLSNPDSEKAREMMIMVVHFINTNN